MRCHHVDRIQYRRHDRSIRRYQYLYHVFVVFVCGTPLVSVLVVCIRVRIRTRTCSAVSYDRERYSYCTTEIVTILHLLVAWNTVRWRSFTILSLQLPYDKDRYDIVLVALSNCVAFWRLQSADFAICWLSIAAAALLLLLLFCIAAAANWVFLLLTPGN